MRKVPYTRIYTFAPVIRLHLCVFRLFKKSSVCRAYGFVCTLEDLGPSMHQSSHLISHAALTGRNCAYAI